MADLLKKLKRTLSEEAKQTKKVLEQEARQESALALLFLARELYNGM